MSELQFKHRLAAVNRLKDNEKHDAALEAVEAMLVDWPGNALLHVVRAALIQLTDGSEHTLEDARASLQDAVELDRQSPAAAIELAYFLDNVEDDPAAASKSFAIGVNEARRLLIDGLIGQAKALHQLGQRKKFLECLSEVLYLVRFEPENHHNGSSSLVKQPIADQIQELMAAAADR